MKEQFLRKFDTIFNAYKAGDEKSGNISDPIESKRTEQESIANYEKTTALFKKLVYALPEEQMTRLHSLLEEKYKEIIGVDRYNSSYLSTLLPPRFPTPESKKYHLFYSTPQILIKNGSAREIVAQAVEHIDNSVLEEMMVEIDSFQSDIIHNVKVEFFRNRVEELKKINAERITDEKHLNELNEELENVAKTVITSTRRYSDAQGETYDKIYRKQAEDRLDELNEKVLSQPEYQHFREYFEVDRTGRYGGNRSISKEHRGDTNMADAFTADNVKLIIPEKTKASILKVFEYMRDNQMLRNDQSGGEQGHKIYGFTAICLAHENLRKIIETTNVEDIRKARELYELEVQRMRGLYDLIRQEFNPGPEMMLGNINSYREGIVPNEFKNDLVINALVSGFFNLNSALTQHNCSIEMLLENPNTAFMQVIKGFADGVMAGSDVKDKNIAQSIKTLTIGKRHDEFPGYGLGRNMEFLQAITHGTDAFEKNSLSSMLISSYATYVANIVFEGDGKALTTAEYLMLNPIETLTNILLVNDEDRDYNKLRSVESLTIDGTEKIPAFDTMKYLDTHTVDAGALLDRIKSTVTELHAQEYFQKNEKATRYTAIANTIRAAQFAAYQFLLVHPVPGEGENIENWDALKDIMTNPELVFKDQIDEKTKEALDKRIPKHKMFESEGKAKIEEARIEERKAEQEYANKTADLRKRFDILTKQFKSGEGDRDAIKKDYFEARTSLYGFQAKEMKRLGEAYEKGYVPTSYYQQRIRDIVSGNVENFIPFGADECVAIARDEARKAEAAYEKNTAALRKKIDKLSKKLDKGGEKTQNEYNKAKSDLSKLREAELERLDKSYAEGKLTKSYYDERRFNVETDNFKKSVPFGLDDAPTFEKFKAQYKNELKHNELTAEDVQMFYDRMMERTRFEDFKFKLVATGSHPKPTLDSEKIVIAPEKESIVVTDIIDNSFNSVSTKIEMPHPDLTKVKDNNQLKV